MVEYASTSSSRNRRSLVPSFLNLGVFPLGTRRTLPSTLAFFPMTRDFPPMALAFPPESEPDRTRRGSFLELVFCETDGAEFLVWIGLDASIGFVEMGF